MGRYLELAVTVISRHKPAAPAIVSVIGYEKYSSPPPAIDHGIPGAGVPYAPCGFPACAGCYDVGDGKKIHPPKCGPDYADLLKRWEPRGRKQ